MGNWRGFAAPGDRLVNFYGPDGRLSARLFRGNINREMSLGIRGLELPACSRQIGQPWDVTVPDVWAQRANGRDRLLMVFKCPTNGFGETVLEFERSIPVELEAEIQRAFGKEPVDGRQGIRTAEADRQDEPLPQAGGAAVEGVDRGRGDDAAQQDEPEGQRLTPSVAAAAPEISLEILGAAPAMPPRPPPVAKSASASADPPWMRRAMKLRHGRR